MPPKKGKKEEIDINDLPPWKSLNIQFNFNTVVKSRDFIMEQIDSID